jgi:hypothetical protein
MLHLARWFVAKVAGYTLGILYPSYMSFKSLESALPTGVICHRLLSAASGHLQLRQQQLRHPPEVPAPAAAGGNETTIGYWLTYWIVWSCITVLEIFDVFIEWSVQPRRSDLHWLC